MQKQKRSATVKSTEGKTIVLSERAKGHLFGEAKRLGQDPMELLEDWVIETLWIMKPESKRQIRCTVPNAPALRTLKRGARRCGVDVGAYLVGCGLAMAPQVIDDAGFASDTAKLCRTKKGGAR